MSSIIAFVMRVYLKVSAFLSERKYDTPQRMAHKLVELPEAGITYHGHMAYTNKGGEYFHACKIAHFKSIKDANKAFEPGAILHLKLVSEIIPMLDGTLLLVYTNVLSQEDQEDNEEWHRERHEFFKAKKAERQAAKLVQEEERLKAEQEEKRYAQLGRKHEANCGKGK